MTQEPHCADQPSPPGGGARTPDMRSRPGRWRPRAARYGQLFDTSHLMNAWGNVDRGASDLRQ